MCACVFVCVSAGVCVCVSAVLISENRPGREQDGEQKEATGEGRQQQKWRIRKQKNK